MGNTELTGETKLRRTLPHLPYLVELLPSGIIIKVKGSRRPGVFAAWETIIDHSDMPKERPAKIGTPREYMKWVREKLERSISRRKEKGPHENGS